MVAAEHKTFANHRVRTKRILFSLIVPCLFASLAVGELEDGANLVPAPKTDGGKCEWTTESLCYPHEEQRENAQNVSQTTREEKEGGETVDKLYTSTCDQDSGWKYFGVSRALKKWIKSIRADPENLPPDLYMDFHEEDEGSGSGLEGNRHLRYIGRLNARGDPVGNYWASLRYHDDSPFNSGFMYGPLDADEEMSGDNIVFIYPDLKTVLVGEFRTSSMISARPTKIVAERCFNGLKHVRLARPLATAPTYIHQEGNEIRPFGGHLTLVDPYETRLVYVQDIPGLGEGVFAKRNIRKGMRIQRNDMSFTDDLDINVPYQYWSLDKYRASLCHKINHSFGKSNCEYTTTYNSRFGIIQGAVTTRDVRKGEQLLVSYGYPIDGLFPPWYVDLYLKEVGHLPNEAARKMPGYHARRGADWTDVEDTQILYNDQDDEEFALFAEEGEVEAARAGLIFENNA